MKPKILLAACFIACLLAGPVFGAVTGSITGTVIDSQSKEPLAGVSVSVDGSRMGSKTDANGRYHVLNVPVGTYKLIFSSIGYAKVEVSNVHVSADLATFQNRELEQETTETGKIITVTAERPMVIKDKTTSVNIVEREQLLAMPTRGFEQVVGIQNSVVRMNSNVDISQRGGRTSVATAPSINLRGGRPSEVAYYVDGFSQQDPLSGISTANINNNAIKEVSVTTGAFSAEYGHVASGIVNVTTNSGTDEYKGNVEVVSDNFASPFGYDSFDQNWYSGDISGPLPGLERAYFFFSGERRFLRDRSPSLKTKEVFEKFGLDSNFEEPQRLPNNHVSGWSYQGKLNFDITSNIKLMLSGNGSIDKWQQYRHSYMNPDFPTQVAHSPKYDDRNQGLNAKITHTLSPETFYNLSISYFRTERHRGDGIVFDDYPAYDRPLIGNPEFDEHNLFREGDSLFQSDIDVNVDPGDPTDTFIAFYESYWGNFMRRKATYIGFKGDLTHQFNTYNTLKIGFDFQRHTVRFFTNLNATQNQDPAFTGTRLNRYGYDIYGMESDADDYKNSTKHPINLGLYLQDRFDWRGFIVSTGIRFDYFDYKALRFKDLENPIGDGSDATIDPEDLEESEKYMRLSPRLGISFPVSDKTQMYINFGKFYQRPDLNLLYTGYDFFEARIDGGSYYAQGSPNLEPEKTTQYEFGLTHALAENVAFTIAAYYKDVTDLTQIFHQKAEPKSYDYYSNGDYGTIKGFDFSLTMRRTNNISLDLKYSLSYATGTGSYAGTARNIAWKQTDGFPKQTFPLDYDQRHSIIGIIHYTTLKGEGPKIGDTYILENFGLNTVIQVSSGTPYTATVPYDAVSPNASVQQIPTGSINSSNLPWSFVIDMKAQKTFNVGQFKLVPYIWVKNLLNTENVYSVYEGTGKPNVSGYLETEEGQVRVNDTNILQSTGRTRGEEYAFRYDLGQQNPKNYANPRMILVGLRMSF
ncbi:MAG: TonB-dependent receptor [candidate division Zixibacteria bacterium]|nr:TonB-dependent receptor [candidate division Zixibacteria bacterium]